MADLDTSAMSDALKEYYDEQKLTDLVAIESPFLGMLLRTKFLGKGVPIPMVTDPGQAAISGSFTTANTNRVGATYERFMNDDLRRVYAIGGINRDLIDLAQTPEGAFTTVRGETAVKLRFVARELAHHLFRSENGLQGKIKTLTEDSPSSGKTTIVVEDFADVRNLGKGANLVASATAAGALHAATAYPIESIVYSTGTIVVTGKPATTSSWAVGSYLHRQGDAPNGSTAIVPSGLQDWIVGSGVAAAAFRGVDRSVNPELLSGIKRAIGSSSIKEVVSGLAADLLAQGGNPDILWVNPKKYNELEMELESNVQYEKVSPPGVSLEAQIGYNAIRISAGNGNVRVMSDSHCPYTKGFMVTMSTLQFMELGGIRQPRMRDMGGGDFLQQQDADAVKFQVEAKGDFAIINPAVNGLIDFAA